MITEEQAIHWLWQQYITARTMADIDFWFDRFTVNRIRQREFAGGVT
jgi:hypothetical protein